MIIILTDHSDIIGPAAFREGPMIYDDRCL
jgi:hypothetical protein